MIRIFCYLLITLGVSTAAVAETLNNQSIVSMFSAGLGEGLIIDKINSLPCGYDVSTDQLIGLKRQGLSEAIVAAMVRRCASLAQQRGIAGDDTATDPLVKHSPGIYVAQTWQTPAALLHLRPSKPSSVKTSGNGSILFPLMERMILNGQVSQVSIRSNSPTFYFYFDTSDTRVSDFGTATSLAAQSPDEFVVAKLRATKDGRELVIGRISAYGGIAMSIKKGVDPKSVVHFQTVPVGDGIFKISFTQPIEPGEYAFVFSGANIAARVYEFSVTG